MKKAKRIGKRFLSLILALMVLMSISVAGAVSATALETEIAQTCASDEMKTFYFSPNGYWNNLFAVYAWTEGTDDARWESLKKVDGVDGLYSVDLSVSYTHAVFCNRTIPGFDWSVVDKKTDELELQDGYNYISLAGESTAIWGYYNSGDMTGDPADTQKVYFTPNKEWTDIQGTLYHDFVVRAWNDMNYDGAWVECTLVEGTVGEYPTVWVAEIPVSYDNIEFCRAESAVNNGWYVWENTGDLTVPADSNLFTQAEDTESGTWSYYTEPEIDPEEPDNPTEPEDPAPEIPTEPVETQTIYFTPNSEWRSYIEDGDGRVSVATPGDDGTLIWHWATKESASVYAVNVPVDAEEVTFGVSFGVTADLVWTQTSSQIIPAQSDYFTQDKTDSTTGTWGIYKAETTGVYYSVVFVNWDNTLLSAQTVSEGGNAKAPEAPSRISDSQYSYTFKGWDKSFENVTSNLIVTAQFDKTAIPPSQAPTTGSLRIEVSGGSGFTLSVNGGAARPQGVSYANTKMPIGVQVTVTANATSDAEFLGWINPVNGQVLSKELAYSFVTGGNELIKASFVVDVDGANMVVFKNDKAAGGKGHIIDLQYYSAGDDIVFPADPAQTGFDFAGWSMTEEEIHTALAAGLDVTVLAKWTKRIVKVNVTVDGGTGTGVYDANFAVTVKANEPESGKKFAYWIDGDGKIRSYDTSYKFYPSADTSLIAVFIAEDEAIDYQVLVSLDTIDTTTNATKNTFYYSWYLPAEAMNVTLVKVGILAVNKDNYNEATFVAGTTDTGNVYERYPDQTIKGTAFWNKSNVTSGQIWMAKAYVQYKNANGEIVTVYSDIVEAVK